MKKIEYLTAIAIIIVIPFLIGVINGYHKGVKDMLKQYESYKEMFDRHTQEQWEMINKRDSLYLQNIQLKKAIEE